MIRAPDQDVAVQERSVPAPISTRGFGHRPRSGASLLALRQPVPKELGVVLATIAPALLLMVWCLATYGPHAVSPDFLPSPTGVLAGISELFIQYDLGLAIWMSSQRIALAFLLAASVAFPLGVLMGSFDVFHRLLEPVVGPLRYMPISAFIPLLILWCGIYETEKIAFLFLGVFVYLLPVVVNAVRAVPEELIDTALTLGATKFDVIRTVLVPAALPEIVDSFRVMNAISWTYVILAESVNADHGLGYMVELARTHQKMSWAFAGLAVIGGIGLATDCLIRMTSAFVFRWREVGA
jgi:NitT/TauT family transport system permease protein